MRRAALIPLLVIAACSDGQAPEAVDAVGTEDLKLEAGQWEIVSEVAKATARDEGPPAIKAAAGTKASISVCVAEDERTKPAPAFLAGSRDDCAYGDFYMARGRINATMVCRRPGLDGDIRHSVSGTYKAGEIATDVQTDTYLVGSGDMIIEAKVTGRRTGACPAGKGVAS